MSTESKCGARFWEVDFHVHTPGSADASGTGYHSEQAAASDVVAESLRAGLNAIVVTDHNTASWLEEVTRAAMGTDLVVLPGVELSTSEGHLLAVFEEGTPTSEIEDLITTAGIPRKSQGDLHTKTSGGFLKVAELVTAAGGIAIPAHIGKDKGLLGIETRAVVTEVLESPLIAAVEAHSDESAQRAQRKTTRPIAVVAGSDSFLPGGSRHELSGIGSRRTWIKAGRPDLAGIRQALADPSLRVRRTRPAEVSHTYVESLTVTGGFLDGETLEFSADLTCLVGGTGSGKSLALELIRFACDQQTDLSDFPKIREEVDSRMESALRTDSSVELRVVTPTGVATVRRAFDEAGSPPPEVMSATEVSEPPPLRAFSQSEVIEYARERVGRMSLLDQHLELEQDLEVGLVAALTANGRAIGELRTELADGERRLEELPSKRERAARLGELFEADVVHRQGLWSKEKIALDGLVASAKDAEDGEAVQVISVAEISAHIDDNEDLFEAVGEALEKYRSAVADARSSIEGAHKDMVRAMARTKAEWTTRRSAFAAELDQQLAKHSTEGSSLSALKVTLGELQEEVAKLESLEDRIASELTPELEGLLRKREEILDQLYSRRKVRREARRRLAKTLNERMKPNVRIKVEGEGSDEEFCSEVISIAKGSHLKRKTLEQLCANSSPIHLVRSYLSDDPTPVADATGLTVDQVVALFDHVRETHREAQFLEVQAIDLPDVLSIDFRQKADVPYRPIEKLAHGEKCTAILVIALAEGNEPLIIDQPEDALHAPWIEDALVERLRDLRGTRQFIFATRSPGLVVSADAEQVIILTSESEVGGVEHSGSLERLDLNRLALYHLEGGPAAFNRRAAKLAPALQVDG